MIIIIIVIITLISIEYIPSHKVARKNRGRVVFTSRVSQKMHIYIYIYIYTHTYI